MLLSSLMVTNGKATDLYAGIDLGTSGIKVIIADSDDQVHAVASRSVNTKCLHDGWNEQDPDEWWDAVCACLDELAQRKQVMARVRGIGLSGQMLGPVLIDKSDKAIRDVILWNDGRSVEECRELLELVPDIGLRTNCTPDPGVGAPKLRWLYKHEPEILDRADCLLLPKDYIRLKLTGERFTEPSDAGGTMLMECADSSWSAQLCEAAMWDYNKLPPVSWAWEPAGQLRDTLADRFNITRGITVAAGAGDNMACSIGVGVAKPGDCAVTIGTSGVICTVDGSFKPLPDKAFLTSHHAAPNAYLSMGVVMSATASFEWLVSLLGETTESLSDKIDALYKDGRAFESPVSAPWLSGNRTPYNQPGSRGTFTNVSASTDASMLGWSILEGVAFQFRECFLHQQEAGMDVGKLVLVGGGANNLLWSKMIATLLGKPSILPVGRHLAACLGATRLAQVAASFRHTTGVDAVNDVLCRSPKVEFEIEPDKQLFEPMSERFEQYQAIVNS